MWVDVGEAITRRDLFFVPSGSVTRGLIGFAVFWSCATAYAQPVIRVQVEGDCPDRAAITEPLLPVRIAEQSELTLRITRGEGSSRMELRDPQGVTERTISSDDCAALAEAFALIERVAEEDYSGLRISHDKVNSSPVFCDQRVGCAVLFAAHRGR